jgi:uncharacterized membrane protein
MFELILMLAVVWLVVDNRSQAGRIRKLEERLDRVLLRQTVEQVMAEAQVADAPAPAPPPAPQAAAAPAAKPTTAPPPLAAAYRSAPAVAKAPRKSPFDGLDFKKLETLIAERWMAWAGGLALALGGIFFVQYSIEAGWLGPVARIALGLLTAAAMIGAGEWLRRRPSMQASPVETIPHLPTAATGAGIITAFAAVLAAHWMYDLVGAAGAFAALGLIAFGALFLSLLHGPFILVLGLAGAFLVPFLVDSANPDPTVLPIYTILVFAAAWTLIGLRGWWKLSLLAAIPIALWQALLAIAMSEEKEAAGPILLYIAAIALPALLAYLSWRPHAKAPVHQEPAHKWLLIAGIGPLLVMAALPQHNELGLIISTVIGTVLLGIVWRERAIDLWGALGAVGVVIAHAFGEFAQIDDAWRIGLGVAAGTLFAGAGWLKQSGAERRTLWALVSAATPLALYMLLYGQIGDLRQNWAWAGVALLLAALGTAAANVLQNRDPDADKTLPFHIYALGAATAVTLALFAGLREGALVTALAVQAGMMAWIYARRLPVGALLVALTALGVLLAFALFAGSADALVRSERLAGTALVNLFLMVAAPLAAVSAARFYLDDKLPEQPRAVLDVAWLGFWLLGILALSRIVLRASGTPLDLGFGTAVLTLLGWQVLMFRAWNKPWPEQTPVLRGMALTVLGFVAVAKLYLLSAASPLVTTIAPPGLWMKLALAAAYLLPALVSLAHARRVLVLEPRNAAIGLAASALGLTFVWLNFQLRDLMADGDLRFPWAYATAVEPYLYSALWLGFGAALFGFGIARNTQAVRGAGLVILGLTVLKVFLSDMGELEGVWQPVSFLGLGACLIGLGVLYRKFIAKSAPAAENA